MNTKKKQYELCEHEKAHQQSGNFYFVAYTTTHHGTLFVLSRLFNQK